MTQAMETPPEELRAAELLIDLSQSNLPIGSMEFWNKVIRDLARVLAVTKPKNPEQVTKEVKLKVKSSNSKKADVGRAKPKGLDNEEVQVKVKPPSKKVDNVGRAKLKGQGNDQEVHQCPRCPKSFPSGQALGGHMRFHNPLPKNKRKKEQLDEQLPINYKMNKPVEGQINLSMAVISQFEIGELSSKVQLDRQLPTIKNMKEPVDEHIGSIKAVHKFAIGESSSKVQQHEEEKVEQDGDAEVSDKLDCKKLRLI